MPSDCEGGCKTYINARIDDHQRQHTAEDAALRAATEAMAARLDAMNEFRAQLVNQAGTFVTRDLLDSTDRRMQVQVEALSTKITDIAATAQRAAIATGVGMGLLGVVGGIVLMRILGI